MKRYKVTVVTEIDYIIEAEDEDVDFWEIIGDEDYVGMKYIDEQMTNIKEIGKEEDDVQD